MFRVTLRLIADAAVVAAAAFGAAGTLAWWRAWSLVAVLLLVRAIGALAVARVHPDTLRERAGFPMRAGQPRVDRVLVLAVLGAGFLGIPAVAGLDVFHWHVLPSPNRVVAGIGLLLFTFGWGLKSLALRANAFAVTAVRHQRERGHTVVDAGVYGVVRHPFYAADPLIFVGSALWLGSYVAALAAVVPVALVVLRLHLEERFLLRALPEYAAYVGRVRHRLIPGIW